MKIELRINSSLQESIEIRVSNGGRASATSDTKDTIIQDVISRINREETSIREALDILDDYIVR